MAKFLLITRGGTMPESPEEGARVMQAWMDWFTSMGGAIVDPGSPVAQVRIVAADGSVASRRRPVGHRLHRRRCRPTSMPRWRWRRVLPSTAT